MYIRTDTTDNHFLYLHKVNSSLLQENIQKLSTGNRINSSKDDAAGLSISERMKSKINQSNAEMNSQIQLKSLYETADGFLSSLIDRIQRVRELFIQNQNGTLSSEDHLSVQKEVNALVDSINNIVNTATYNKLNIFEKSNNLFDLSSYTERNPGAYELMDETSFKVNSLNYRYYNHPTLNLKAGVTYTVSYSNKTEPMILELKRMDGTALVNRVINGSYSFTPSVDETVYTKFFTSTVGTVFKDLQFTEGNNSVPYEDFGLKNLGYGTRSINLNDLGLNNLNVSDGTSIQNIDQALNILTKDRQVIGAKINTANFNVMNKTISITNDANAISKIKDVNFADTSSDLAKTELSQQTIFSLIKRNYQNRENAIELLQK
ncbi:flagellin N-terminal helical domain-containing protein [Priestia aryabhattai]